MCSFSVNLHASITRKAWWWHWHWHRLLMLLLHWYLLEMRLHVLLRLILLLLHSLLHSGCQHCLTNIILLGLRLELLLLEAELLHLSHHLLLLLLEHHWLLHLLNLLLLIWTDHTHAGGRSLIWACSAQELRLLEVWSCVRYSITSWLHWRLLFAYVVIWCNQLFNFSPSVWEIGLSLHYNKLLVVSS